MHFTPLTIRRNTAIIHLTRGFVCLVDADDWEHLSQWKWNALVHASRDPSYTYARRSKGRKVRVLMHREITGASEGEEVDHRNHKGLDNRRENLLVTNRFGNAQNVRKAKGCTSRFIGVCKIKGWWVAQVLGARGERVKLGKFSDEAEAARVRDEYVRRYYENPVLNFPISGENALTHASPL